MGHPRGAGRPRRSARATIAWVDESNYYYIKVENEPEDDGEIQSRTLVLDNLIHGYFILDHPERLDYDYEHIYALVAYRAAKASGKVIFKPAAEVQEPETPPIQRLRSPGQSPRDAGFAEQRHRRRPPKSSATKNRHERSPKAPRL